MRLSKWPFLVVWGALIAAQVCGFVNLPRGLGFLAAAGLQVAKAYVTSLRLRDLGQEPDDAMLAFIPLGNLRLWVECLASTPSPAVHAQRVAAWQGQRSSSALYLAGLRTLFANPALLAFVALVFGAGATAMEFGVMRLAALPSSMSDPTLLGQAAFGLAGLLGLYTFVQLTKRRTASRRSWAPSLAFVPVFLLAACLMMGGIPALPEGGVPLAEMMGGGGHQDLLVVSTLASVGGFLLLRLFAGAFMGTMIADLAQRESRGEPAPFSETLKVTRERWLDVAGPRGLSVLAVIVGQIIVVPGILYALQYAFVDVIALTRPDARALAASGTETRGVRRRIFKVYAIGFFLGVFLATVAAVAAELLVAGDSTQGALISVAILQVMPPALTGIRWTTLAVGFGVQAVFVVASYAGLAHLYFERRLLSDLDVAKDRAIA